MKHFLSFAVALGVSCAGWSALDTTFTNTTGGVWSDEANWSAGVPNGSGDVARVAPGVREIENDVEGLTLQRFAAVEGGTTLDVRGRPMTVSAFGLGSRYVHFHNDLTVPDAVTLSDGLLYLNGTNNVLSASIDIAVTRRLVLEPPAGLGPVTNVTTAGRALNRISARGQLLVSPGAGTEVVQDVRNFVVPAHEGEISVAPGSMVRLANVDVNGTLLNANAGSVVIGRSPVEGRLGAVQQASSGSVSFAAETRTDEYPAFGALVHLDASDASAFEYKDGDPAAGVVRWNGVDGAGYAYHDGCVTGEGEQVLPQRREGVLNGRAVVDFGAFIKSYGTASNRAKSGYLILSCGANADYDIYTAFVVECAQNFVFCSQWSGTDLIFHGNDSWTQIIISTRGEAHVDFRNPADPKFVSTGLGLLHLNGVAADAWSARLSGEDVYDSIAVRAETKPIKIGRLAWDRGCRVGGAKIAEIILYGRKLTDAEFAQTEAYLRNKWQNAGMVWTAPAVNHRVGSLVSRSAAPFRIEPGAVVAADRMHVHNDSGVRVFTGGGTLQLARVTETLQNARHPLTVRNGTLRLSGSGTALEASADDPIRDCQYHLDATVAESFTFAADGAHVLEWRDVDGKDFKAVYPGDAFGNEMPRRVEGLLNGRAGVDFGPNNSKQCLLWSVTNTTMKTVFLVYAGPRADVNFLLGDTYRSNRADFHAGDWAMFYPDGYVADAIKSADVRVNGKSVSWNGFYLANEPCVVMIAGTGGNMSAAAFAVDRWGHPSNGYAFRSGGQQICEAVFYDRVLDTAEREAVQNWLMKKWLPRPPAGYALGADDEQFDEVVSAARPDETVTLDVPAGETSSVGALGGTSFTKTGEGVLTVGSVDGLSGCLSVAAGTVKFAARELPADWTPPAGHVSDGSAADDVRAVFVVYDQESGGLPLPPSFGRTALDTYRIDGALQDSAVTEACPAGRHVASLMTAGRRSANAWTFGENVKEALVFTRPLTDRERRDTEAYLMRKWCAAAAPGYRGATIHLRSLALNGGTFAFEDPQAVVEVGGLTGAGTAVLPAGARIRLVGPPAATAERIPQEGLLAHFDMTRADTLTTVEEDGRTYVTEWRDVSGRHVAAAPDGHRPWILRGDCNGHDTLCTGPFTKSGQSNDASAWMVWDRPDLKARTVIEVIGVQEGGNFIVCSNPQGGLNVPHRGGNTGSDYRDVLLAPGRVEPKEALYGAGALFAINGEKVVQTATGFPSASYHSVTVRVDPDYAEADGTPGFFCIGTFALDRTWRWGGQRVCEVLAYDRRLTDDELGALEAYLQGKWFGRMYRDYVSGEAIALEIPEGTTLDLAGTDRQFTSVSGSGMVVGGTLHVTESLAAEGLTVDGTLDFASPTGTVRLARAITQPCDLRLVQVSAVTGPWRDWTVDAEIPAWARARLVMKNGWLTVSVSGSGTLLLIR